MNISANYAYYGMSPVTMGTKKTKRQTKKSLTQLLEPFQTDKKATVPARSLLKGVNLNSSNPFDTFKKVDDATRKINFVKSQDDWESCLTEEFIEFKEARREYEENRTQQNFDHMQEEMGDIFYTAASIAKNAGIDSQEAFSTTVRKNGNRLNLMEIMSGKDLSKCSDSERRGLWNSAKRKMYDAQALQYLA